MVRKRIKVENEQFVRDVDNNAILSTDKTALSVHRLHRRKNKEDKQVVEDLKAQVDELKKLVASLLKDKE